MTRKRFALHVLALVGLLLGTLGPMLAVPASVRLRGWGASPTPRGYSVTPPTTRNTGKEKAKDRKQI